jgi:hypothetical protein
VSLSALAYSRHPEGVDLLDVDGSVHFLPNNTTDLVRLGPGTIAGNEVFLNPAERVNASNRTVPELETV